MAYSLRDQWGNALPIRIIADRSPHGIGTVGTWHTFQICDALEPFDWTHDSCARSDQRYEVYYRADSQPQYFHWYEIIEPDDTVHDIEIKLKAFADVKTARLNYEHARDSYTRVLGRSPEICRRCK